MGRSKCIAFILSLALAVFLLAPTALAAEGPDLTRPASLTLTFRPDGTPAQGVEFRAWRVAELDSSGGFLPLSPYDEWPVEIAGADRSEWFDLAATLEVYVTIKKPVPTASAVTDGQGKAVFPNLEPGFYLVTGEPIVGDGTMYIPQPVMLCLPVLHEGMWIYDVNATAKYDEIPEGSGDEIPQLRVVKIWQDPEGEEHPGQVTVQLLKDGQVWDTVVLNQDNNWRHTWTGLEENARWQVAEPTVPEGYTVTITREGDAFLVTNTSQDIDIPPDQPPLDPDAPDGPDKPDQPDKPDKPDQPDSPNGDKEKLPQTGMLWWPVPLLAVSGMGCFLAGWVVNRKEHDDKA